MSFRNTSKISALVLLSFLSFILFCHASSLRIDDQDCDKYNFDPSSFPDKDFDYLLTNYRTLWSPSQNESDHKADCLKYYWFIESRKVLDWAAAQCNLDSTQMLLSLREFFLRNDKTTPFRSTEGLLDKIRKLEKEENRLLYSLKDKYYKEEEEKKSGKVAEHKPHCLMNFTSSVQYNWRRPVKPRSRDLLLISKCFSTSSSSSHHSRNWFMSL